MAPSPMQELALTAMGASQGCSATRDVRAEAQLQKVFSAAPAVTQAAALEMTQQMKVDAKEMAGVTAPLGFFDPFGFTTSVSDGTLLFLREAELKHGRVCMLAFLGIIAGEKWHPFLGGNVDLAAFQVRKMFLETDFQSFWAASLAALGGLEGASIRTQYDEPYWEFDGKIPTGGYASQNSKQERLPGDLSFDPLRLKPKEPKELKTMQTKEILNGRLAMIAVAGIFAQELATGQKVFQ